MDYINNRMWRFGVKRGLAMVLLCVVGCGYSEVGAELTGQVKRVSNIKPIICPDRIDADISLGVMRGGVGSMSSEDQWVVVPFIEDQALLRLAAASGALVKVQYDVQRAPICSSGYLVRHVELLK